MPRTISVTDPGPPSASRVRLEKAVVHPLLLMRQLHGAPHYAPACDSQEGRDEEIRGKER